MSKNLSCEACAVKTDELYQRNTDGKWVCFSCVPASDWKAYPHAKANAETRTRRAARGGQS